VIPVGDGLRVELEGRSIELSGDAAAYARLALAAAVEPVPVAAVERATGLSKREAKEVLRLLREAEVLREVVPASARLTVRGSGPLAAALKAQLKGRWIPAALPRTQVAVLGALNAPPWHAALRALRGSAVAVSVEGATVWAGPLEEATGAAPCPLCLALRRAAATSGAAPSAGAIDLPLAAAQVIAAIGRGLAQRAAEIHRGSLTLHPLVPVAGCARCDAKAAGSKRSVSAVLELDTEWSGPSDDVREAFSNSALGLFELRRHQNPGAFLELPLVVGGVRAILRGPKGFEVRAQGSGIFGSGYSAAQRELVAFCEGVERYALVTQRPDVEATPHARLKDAVAPDEAIPLPRRAHRKNEPLDWAWALELTTRAPRLLPFDALAVRPRSADPLMKEPFFTGGAVHTTYRRALARALGECIERDAYLLAYYLQLPLQWIVPNDLGDGGGALARRFLQSRGISVAFADLGVDLPVPTVLGVATATRVAGGWPVGGRLFSASSGESEAAAIDRATSEILGQYSALSAAEPGTPLHALGVDAVSGEQPEWWPMFARYLEPNAPMPFTFAPEQPRTPMSGSAPPLEELLAELAERGLRAWARPLEGTEVRQSGLCAVKVYVPGLLRPAATRAELAFVPGRLEAVAKKWKLSPDPREGEHPLA
jgi:thiazole/oxazole-forming peptide maturase SagD family component